VVLHGDGGGKVPALARALFGRPPRGAHAGRWFAPGSEAARTRARDVEVNGQPGAILMAAADVVA
jgi:RNA polymerase sigma-70 factor (ECF subfamily)